MNRVFRRCNQIFPRLSERIRQVCHQRPISTNSRIFQVSEEVQQAIAEKRPVVALETTIYTHGFPYPQNLSLASRLESLIRVNGGVPATIGILNGVARVGMGADELVELVSSGGKAETMKISRRDLGFALGSRDVNGKAFNGGTTIAGTMILAHMAGIKIFATGGLGGVHRGAEETMDVSADLTELGRTPVAVISSGCKAFLDLPKTLEFLETQGVPVAAFSDGRKGQVDFPAFWTRESGVPAPKSLRNELEAAEIIHAHLSLGLQSGLHFANPIPEQHSLPKEAMEVAIYEALEHAKIAGAVGAAATPYILNKIKEVTGDRTIGANRALVEANVVRGTKVAAALSRLELEGVHSLEYRQAVDNHKTQRSAYPSANSKAAWDGGPSPTATNATIDSQSIVAERLPTVFVAGSLAVDLSCDYALQPTGSATGDSTLKPALHTSNPALITQSLGGVGGNVARAAHLMGAHVQLCSAVGDDLSGKVAVEALRTTGMSTAGLRSLSVDGRNRTAQYVAINDSNKDLVMGMADMAILESTETGANSLTDAFHSLWLPQLREARPLHLLLDANWASSHLTKWLQAGKEINTHISFEPVSTAKAVRLFNLPKPAPPDPNPVLPVFPNPALHLMTPNSHELSAMYTAARESGHFDRADWWSVVDAFGISSTGARTQLALATTSALVDQGVPQQSLQLLPFVPTICTKLGKKGVLVTQLLAAKDPRLADGKYAPYILSRCANDTEESLGVGGVYMRLFAPVEEVDTGEIVSVNGAGDTFLGALIAGMAKKGANAKVEEYVDLAQRAAVLTLRSKESVSPGLGTLRILA